MIARCLSLFVAILLFTSPTFSQESAVGRIEFGQPLEALYKLQFDQNDVFLHFPPRKVSIGAKDRRGSSLEYEGEGSIGSVRVSDALFAALIESTRELPSTWGRIIGKNRSLQLFSDEIGLSLKQFNWSSKELSQFNGYSRERWDNILYNENYAVTSSGPQSGSKVWMINRSFVWPSGYQNVEPHHQPNLEEYLGQFINRYGSPYVGLACDNSNIAYLVAYRSGSRVAGQGNPTDREKSMGAAVPPLSALTGETYDAKANASFLTPPRSVETILKIACNWMGPFKFSSDAMQRLKDLPLDQLYILKASSGIAADKIKYVEIVGIDLSLARELWAVDERSVPGETQQSTPAIKPKL